jgi:hypothetical protein
MSAPEIMLTPSPDNDQSNEHVGGPSLRYKILGEAAHTSSESPMSVTRYDMFRNGHHDENGIARSPGTQTTDSQISEEVRAGTHNDLQVVVYQPPDKYDGTIRQNSVRVLTFTPRERTGVSHRKPAAILDTWLLVYRKGLVSVEKSPAKPDQTCKIDVVENMRDRGLT